MEQPTQTRTRQHPTKNMAHPSTTTGPLPMPSMRTPRLPRRPLHGSRPHPQHQRKRRPLQPQQRPNPLQTLPQEKNPGRKFTGTLAQTKRTRYNAPPRNPHLTQTLTQPPGGYPHPTTVPTVGHRRPLAVRDPKFSGRRFVSHFVGTKILEIFSRFRFCIRF